MRTTVNIDDELLKKAKIAAIERDSTLSALVEQGLRTVVAPAKQEPPSKGSIEFPAHIAPNDAQAVIDYMKHVGDDWALLRAIGPFPSRKGRPTRKMNWADSSALIEELEGPLAGP